MTQALDNLQQNDPPLLPGDLGASQPSESEEPKDHAACCESSDPAGLVSPSEEGAALERERIPTEMNPKGSNSSATQPIRPLSAQTDQPFGRHLLKTRLCQLVISKIKELADKGTLDNRAEWPTSRQMWLTDPGLRARYKRANALGDALGRGHGREGGLKLTVEKNRVVPSSENLSLCEQHLIAEGSSSQEIASLAGLSLEAFQDWVARLPRNNHFLPGNAEQGNALGPCLQG